MRTTVDKEQTMIKLVGVDFDGTMSDTVGMVLETYRDSVSPYAGHILSDEEISAGFGMTEEGMMNLIIPEHSKEAIETFYELFRKTPITAVPGIRELITELKDRGIILAAITGRGVEGLNIGLNNIGMKELYDEYLTGSDEFNNKHINLMYLMDKYNLRPDEIVYIGDAVSDFEACEKVGVRCMSAAWTSRANKEALKKLNPGNVYESVEALRKDLLEII